MGSDGRPLWSRAGQVAVVLFAIANAPCVARAQDVTLQSAGGTGGNPYSVSCGENALVGLRGQAGTNILGQGVVFNMNLWCVGLNADGSWDGSPSMVGTLIGKAASGPTVNMMCPTHMAVSGIKGRAGNYVSDVEVVCSTVGPGGLLSGSPRGPDASAGVTQLAGSGLVADAPYGLFQCTSNYPGKGLTGRAHDWTDQIALVCGIPHEKQVVVASVSLPQDNNVVSGGTLSGTVTLNAPAPVTGMVVDLHDQSTFFTTPPQLIYAGGQKTAPFVIHARPQASLTIAQVSASVLSSPSVQAVFAIHPPSIASIVLTPSYVHPGTPVTGRVVLAGKAYSGTTVSLFTGDATVATIPSSVSLAVEDTTVTFPITVVATGNACTYISAGLGASGKQAYLAVEASTPELSRTSTKFPLRLSGQIGSPQLTLSVPSSSSPTAVSLTSSNPAVVAVPSTITVPAQATHAYIGLTITNSFLSSTCVTITARDATSSSNVLILMLNGTQITAIIG